MKIISIVIPAYNEEHSVAAAVSALGEVLTQAEIGYECIFVDDGSTDHTWDVIEASAEQGPHVRGVRFSRNFGKEAAIMAGLAEAKGDCALVMDCDLQNPPEKIPEMYALWQEGYEIIEGVKRSRGKETAGYGLMSRLFNRIMSKSTGVDMSKASDFRLLDRKVVTVLLNIRDRNLFFRAASSLLGFKKTEVPFDVRERQQGSSKWSKGKLFSYAVTNITSYTKAPMKIIIGLGGLMLLLTIIFGGISLYQYFTGQALGGFTTVILLQLLIGSISLLSVGIVGYYLMRVFDEVRDRPRYVVSERTEDRLT